MMEQRDARIRPTHLLMGAAFLLGLLITGREFLNAAEIALIWQRLPAAQLVCLAILPIPYLWLKGERFAELFALSGPPIEQRRTRRLTLLSYVAAQMATLLPGGYVARVGLMESSLGMGARAVIPTLIEKLVDLLTLVLLGLVAGELFFGNGRFFAFGGTLAALFFAIACSGAVRRGARMLTVKLASRVVREELVEEALAWRSPGLHASLYITIQTAGVLVLELVMLWISFYALGVRTDPFLLVVAFCLADLVGRIAPTPGGVGFTEIGMVSLLHTYGGVDLNAAAAATLLSRALLFLLPAGYGALCYGFLWTPLAEKGSRTPGT